MRGSREGAWLGHEQQQPTPEKGGALKEQTGTLDAGLPGLEGLPNELASTQSTSSAQAGVSPPDPGSLAPDTGLNTRQTSNRHL